MEMERFLDLLYARRSAALCLDKALDGAMDFDAWRGAVRETLQACLGGAPARLPDVNIRELEPPPRMDVHIRRIVYCSEEGLQTPAYVLRPKDAEDSARLPAVIAITGHGYGHRACAGLTPDGRVMADLASEYMHGFALTLCRRGFMVVAPEMLGFGDLRFDADKKTAPDASSCGRLDGALKLLGRTLSGVRVLQARRAIDVLAELGGADMDRIGMMGISGGGLVTAFAAALDDRLRACVVSGYANTFKKSVMAVPHCVDNFFMGLADALEMPDILASIAPRPMLWEAGDEDPIFPMDGVLEARRAVARAYAAFGAEDNFQLDAFAGGHQISGALAYDFLKNALT
jgi:dienelactone hydrolase